MKTSVETITPDLARSWLENNAHNRPITKSWVDHLCGAMVRGEWVENGEAIKLAKSGRLLDGQQRLTALLKAHEQGVSHFRSLVVRDLPDVVFDTLDQGRKRSAADVFSMRGEQHTAALAAALRGIRQIQSTNFATSYTVKQLEETLSIYPAVRHWVREFVGSKARLFMPSALVSVLTLGAEKHGDELAETFLYEIATGERLSQGDPALVLRERFLEARSSVSKKMHNTVAVALTIKAWNARAQNKKIGTLRKFADEVFPILK